MDATFILLGTGAGPGLPSFFCDCAGCREARDNPALARTRSGAFIDTGNSKLLIDASPDLRHQLIRESITRVDGIFMTHWHYDHFGGLGELEYYIKLARNEAIPIYLPPSAVEQFTAAFPNLTEAFAVKSWQFARQYRVDSLGITPLPANHGIETAGFLLETAGTKLAYYPDTAGLPAVSAGKVNGVDWLICDATFHGDNWFPQAHMSLEQAVDLGRQIGAKNTVLTHLAVHYSRPATSRQLAEEAAAYENVCVAYDGMRIKL
ncbi:MBL fold metallo-hydrolase [Sporomusa acidovorans]|uniref:Phosphoribosyl 1,2-cyclic phosphate phosphodiesterase n=1 Tax=Sporomusa acidovorans (strain ATCC 49682 / DSM 3132 / Mol) TaxID=1123286 RepID=A0ABZ3IZH1_SPOA4|nr:MBL fold metallo-hydrolase [Sporomusa acidovorans]OZC14193.1 phosphoribosyl 1,2-cyclic phosphodiesterase [Sporomusa acidovorans DSM 3132]SDE70858.1 phosphoribosyl 1,2-cyclic phosphate phosphodiesterase [Sporomusa acidovorans]